MALSKIDPAGLDIGQIGGRRNLIINGAYTIWQRAITSSSNGVNTADRWQQNDATFTQETSIVPDNFQYSMKVVANGSGTPLLLQKIERPQVCGHILNQSITVSFYARSSNVNAITKLELNDEGGSGGRPDGGAQTLSAADTWERITHTFTAPFSSLTGNSVAVILTFATSATVYISGFQVEVGTVATPFEHISYGEQLALCQRYYQRVGSTSGDSMVPIYATKNTTNQALLGYSAVQCLRATPTVAMSGSFNLYGDGSGESLGAIGTVRANQIENRQVTWTQSAGGILSSSGKICYGYNANAYFEFDAEL